MLLLLLAVKRAVLLLLLPTAQSRQIQVECITHKVTVRVTSGAALTEARQLMVQRFLKRARSMVLPAALSSCLLCGIAFAVRLRELGQDVGFRLSRSLLLERNPGRNNVQLWFRMLGCPGLFQGCALSSC